VKTVKTICGLGELLWDLLPAGERLGGAPANFTVMGARLGNRGVIASRLGADEHGERARKLLRRYPVDQSFVQTDLDLSTGTVTVEMLDAEPQYEIHAPAAWDFLDWTTQWEALAREADAVCFGTLAQRAAASQETIRSFLHATKTNCVRVFDVNLREPYYSARTIAESLLLATIFKLNAGEVPVVLELLGASVEAESARRDSEQGLLLAARWLIARYPLDLVVITMGRHGSLLVSREAFDRHPGVEVRVVDTVGAGDAFTAALVDAYLHGASLATMNAVGNRVGAWVASQPGAMPEMDVPTADL